MRVCETADCSGVAVRFVTCEGEGAWPYCAECADMLVKHGHEEDRVPVEVITDEMVERAAAALRTAPLTSYEGMARIMLKAALETVAPTVAKAD